MADQAAHKASGGVQSTVHILGHPVHPMIIPFPIAFLVAAAATDVVFFYAQSPEMWATASLWLIGAGFITGAVAAGAGLIDFLTIERARRHLSGWVHFLGNAVVLVVALVNWLPRIGDVGGFIDPWGLILSLLTAVVLIVTGWTGGELSYRHQIGVTGNR